MPASFGNKQFVQKLHVAGQGRIVPMPEKIHVRIEERWWVLRHLNPKMIDVQLSQLNEQRATDNLEALVYFIPHQYAKEAVFKKENDKAYNSKVKENNDLRSALHYYLFIKATEPELNALVNGEWNRTSRIRLTICRSKNGQPLWAAAKDMDDLIALMREHREMFNLEVSPEEFKVDDKVMLKAKVFKGYEFYVTQVRKTGQGASLTLEYPIFNGRFILKTESQDVARQALPMKLQELLSPGYVRRVDQTLTEIVRHRYGRRKSLDNRKQVEIDSEILHDLQFLSYMEFDDSQIHNHVKTLLLLHAVLRKDRHSVEHYIPMVEQMLRNPDEAATDEDAFMMAVLYLATQNVNYRDAAKQYGQKHETLSAPLAQLMPVIKYIRFRSSNKKKISKKLEKKLTKQIEETIRQIRDCDFSSLSPQAADAVWDILALSPYDTEEGHALQTKLETAACQSLSKVEMQLQRKLTDADQMALETEKHSWQKTIQRFSGIPQDAPAEITQKELNQARSNMLHTVHPSAGTLVSYYEMLVRLHPDRLAIDSADLYQEFMKILLDTYAKNQRFTTSWWQLKAVLERYYHAKRHS